MNYIVIEIQTAANGTVATLMDSFTDRNTAEQKYHLILSSAAVSQLPCHAAVMLTEDGRMVGSQAYKHAQPEPEPEVEPDPEEPEEPQGE